MSNPTVSETKNIFSLDPENKNQSSEKRRKTVYSSIDLSETIKRRSPYLNIKDQIQIRGNKRAALRGRRQGLQGKCKMGEWRIQASDLQSLAGAALRFWSLCLQKPQHSTSTRSPS